MVKKMKVIRYTSLILSIFLLALGLFLSGQVAKESQELTDTVMVKLGIVSQDDVNHYTRRYETYKDVFREVMHFVMYSIAAVVLFIFFYSLKRSAILAFFMTMVVVVVYTFFDEYRQTFVSGRGTERLDFILDISGGFLGSLICSIGCLIGRIGAKHCY